MKSLGLMLTIQILLSTTVMADSIKFRVLSESGEPVHSAIITAGEPKDQIIMSEALMDQVDREFSPYVLSVHEGQKVSFPNKDSVRHHVYSFSAAKQFELRLYSGRPADPIEFDQSGAVVLGCNIHDNMVGYVYVTKRPFKTTTDSDGEARLNATTEISTAILWHPNLSLDSQAEITLDLTQLEQVVEHDETIHIVNLEIPTPPDNPQAAKTLEDRFKRFNFE